MKVIKFISIILATVLAIAVLVWLVATFPDTATLVFVIFSGIATAGTFLWMIWFLLVSLWKAL